MQSLRRFGPRSRLPVINYPLRQRSLLTFSVPSAEEMLGNPFWYGPCRSSLTAASPHNRTVPYEAAPRQTAEAARVGAVPFNLTVPDEAALAAAWERIGAIRQSYEDAGISRVWSRSAVYAAAATVKAETATAEAALASLDVVHAAASATEKLEAIALATPEVVAARATAAAAAAERRDALEVVAATAKQDALRQNALRQNEQLHNPWNPFMSMSPSIHTPSMSTEGTSSEEDSDAGPRAWGTDKWSTIAAFGAIGHISHDGRPTQKDMAARRLRIVRRYAQTAREEAVVTAKRIMRRYAQIAREEAVVTANSHAQWATSSIKRRGRRFDAFLMMCNRRDGRWPRLFRGGRLSNMRITQIVHRIRQMQREVAQEDSRHLLMQIQQEVAQQE